MRLPLIGALAFAVSGCVGPLTQEQVNAFEAEYRPFARAAVAPCIATALGQRPNYSALEGLGYTSRASLMGEGTYFYRNDGVTLIPQKKGVKFVNGQGCDIDVTDPGPEEFQILGRLFREEIERLGHSGTAGRGFSFTVNGVPMSLTGRRSTSSHGSTTTYDIKRQR